MQLAQNPWRQHIYKKKIYNLHSNEQLEINNLSFIPCLIRTLSVYINLALMNNYVRRLLEYLAKKCSAQLFKKLMTTGLTN